ncbi:recombinase family protein [Longispora albida]|uniref:recombinase family protein n=1 Tax=Longispora albida TaxID=203523 RepID=UPI0003A30A14|nr:recombinase family protein [Longispora albida]
MANPSRRIWKSIEEFLAAGESVAALTYERASADRFRRSKRVGKSVKDQHRENLAVIARRGWTHLDSFRDNDLSASRYATKGRPGFELLMEAIASGRGDVLVVWELARTQRDLAVYVELRDLCLENGLRFWMVGDRLYDLANKDDKLSLGNAAIQGEYNADNISAGVQRGLEGTAIAGMPHGRAPYGYRRVYDPETKEFVRQEPDDTEHVSPAGIKYTPAKVVREIFGELEAGRSITRVTQSLNDRKIPSPGGKTWARSAVRLIGLTPTYAGLRAHYQNIYKAVWEGIVTPETYWAVKRLLSDPSRVHTRPSRAQYLLSYIARCEVCKGPLARVHIPYKGGFDSYRCLDRGCGEVRREEMDDFANKTMIKWLSDPEIHAKLIEAAGTSDEETQKATIEKTRLELDLENWERQAIAGSVTPEFFGKIQVDRIAKIKEQEEIIESAKIPSILRGLIGPDAERRWGKAPLEVKREALRLTSRIEVAPTGDPKDRYLGNLGKRVDWDWIYGKKTKN